MAVSDQTTQFVPEKAPNIFSRLRNLTPKNKRLFWGAVAVGVIIIVLIIYFVFAAPTGDYIYFDPDDGQYGQNDTFNVDVMLDVDSADISAVHTKINYDTSILEIIDVQEQDFPLVFSADIKTPGLIEIMGGNPQFDNDDTNGFKGKQIKLATLKFKAIDTANRTRLTVGMIEVVKDDGQGTLVNYDKVRASYKIGDNIITDDYLYFDPSEETFRINETFDVDVMLNVETADIVAFSSEINYDNIFLTYINGELGELDIKFDDIDASTPGIIKITAGEFGDNDDTNGFKGKQVKIATLTFKAINLTNQTRITADELEVVRDDGSPSPNVLDYQAIDGVYEITGEDISDDLEISYGPRITSLKPDPANGLWEVTIYWRTNILSDGKIIYGASQSLVDGNEVVQVGDNTLIHTLTQNGLIPDATYYYKVVSQDDNGNLIESAVQSFITEQEIIDPIGLEIIDLSADPSYNSVIISWTTSLPATTIISGCFDYNGLALTTMHSVEIPGLTMDQAYTCLVESTADGETVRQSINFNTRSGPAPDANVVLKVERNRECDKWMYCRSSLQITNRDGEKENLCFDVGACDDLDPEGGCAREIESDVELLEFTDPTKMSDLSGLSKVGFTWDENTKINGYYPYKDMNPVGTNINIPNSDFESGEIWPWAAGDNVKIAVVNDSQDKTNKVLQITPLLSAGGNYSNAKAPIGWISSGIGYNYAISLGIRAESSGIAVNKIVWVQLLINNDYNSSLIEKVPVSGYWQTIILSSDQPSSQFHTVDREGDAYLNLASSKTDPGYNDVFNDVFYVDNISMKSVLQVAANEYQTRSCRLYPSSTALGCDYTDISGKQYRGWRGFCVEEDPKYENADPESQMCLNWWPVDILPGETDIFGSDEQAGYAGRQPLYYCLEAEGQYPYSNYELDGGHEITVDGDDGSQIVEIFNTTISDEDVADSIENWWEYDENNLNGFKIHKDEILEIRMNGVQIDHNNNDYRNDCWLSTWPSYPTESTLNPAITCDTDSCEGAIVFNHVNKEHWTDKFDEKDDFGNLVGNRSCSDTIHTGSFNPYAYLHCANEGTNDECNIVSARLEFDSQDFLKSMEYKYNDASARGGSFKFKSVTISFMGDRCNVITMVVKPNGENAAWSSRIKEGGWTQNNYLGYEYNDNYYPYGAAVVDNPASDPTQWAEPLYVMPANTATGKQPPYQIRAGSPYSVSSEGDEITEWKCTNPVNQGDTCSGGNSTYCEENGICEMRDKGWHCRSDSILSVDCDKISGGMWIDYYDVETKSGGKTCYRYDDQGECPNDSCTMQKGVCEKSESTISGDGIGKTQCVAGRAEMLGQSCENDLACGYSMNAEGFGLCVGIELDEEQIANIGGGWEKGWWRLRNLFAKSYGIWKWDWTEKKYKEFYPDEPEENFWDITLMPDYGNYKPRVTNIKVSDTSISGTKAISLSFNSIIDENHLPLTSIKIDWGDGSVISQLTNLKIAGRGDPEKPHVFFHTYETGGSYIPRIQIQDNWGWCNNGTDTNMCPSNRSGWTEFEGRITVTK